MIISMAGLLFLGWVVFDNQQKSRTQDIEVYRNFLVQEGQRLNQAFSQLISVSDLLKKNPIVVNSLGQHAKGKNPTPSAVLIVNKNLESIASIDKISSVFLMDANGLCVYASKKSFVGKNYGFRPYFKDAMAWGSGLYVAMGVTSRQPGIYFAQPVVDGTHILGVAVIKIMPSFFDLRSVLSAFAQTTPTSRQLRMGLTTASGIFIDAKNNSLASFETLSGKQLQELRKTRQFPPERISSLDFPKGSFAELVDKNLLEVKNTEGVDYLLFKEELMSGRIFLLHIVDAQWFRSSYRPVSSSYKTLMYIMGSVLLVLMAFLYFLNRQHHEMLAAAEEARRETKQRLKEKRKYETIINRNPEGFCLFDAESQVIHEVNQSFCQLFGRPEEQILGSSIQDIIVGPKDKNCCVSDNPESSAGRFESRLYLENGQTIDVLIHFGEITDKETLKKDRFCFVTDITERKKEQEQLLLFSRVIEQSPSGIVITDRHGVIVYVNQAFEKITGYSSEEACGRKPSILNSGKTDPETFKVLWEVLLSGRNWKGYLRNRKKDGTLYWEGQVMAPVFDSQHRISHFFAIKNDITERIILEHQIASKSAELELIVDHAAIGISYIVDHKFLWVSASGAEMFGYESKDDVAGLATELIFQSREVYEETIIRSVQSFQNNEVFEDEQLLKKRDGTLFWCSLKGKAVNPADLSQGAIWLTQDISDQKEVEKQLQLARDRAQQASREKSSFLANMSHEIRTPMNSIIGMSRLALETPLDAQQQYLLETIRHSADFLLALINDILDFSKIEAGRFELDSHPFELETVIAQVLQTMEFLARKKGLALKSRIAPDTPRHVVGDDLRLRQILHNLVGNAIKFTETGEIWIRVSPGKDQKNGEDVQLDFEVEDNGIGIAPEKQATIFDSFVQADTSISRNFGGSGLGLAISSQLCRLMGGEMKVKSEPGNGSTFCFSVVLKRSFPKKCHQLEEQERAGDSFKTPLRILLVDDNSANRYLAQAIFKKGDHQVVEAENGMEALTILLDHHFDVILMDVQMPKMDGITATRIIRSCENGKREYPERFLPVEFSTLLCSRLTGGHIPIVALTAHALSEDREQCLEAGMDAYAVKPFKPQEIYHAISQSIGSE